MYRGQYIRSVSSGNNMGYGKIYGFLREARVINRIIRSLLLLEKVMEFLMEYGMEFCSTWNGESCTAGRNESL